MLTVDIDVGGTLTDGIFRKGEQVVCVKVDTTGHDLTVCLFDCLAQGASQLGFENLDALLDQVDVIRWSTTITSNVLAEQRGPRLGLIISHGHEADLFGNAERSPLLDRLISAENVMGIDPEAPETEIMNAVHALLESGVRRICVSLRGANRAPAAEVRVKRIIDQQYPDHFLGSVPVLAGSDVSRVADDGTRTACALINAYTHGALAATLFKAEDELREAHNFAGAFLVSHINGGVSGIAKTKAIDTMESGPVLGIHGSSHLAKALGLDDVIALDVGGTTAKVSVLEKGEPFYRKPSDLFGISLGISLPFLRSIALGGGSVVKVMGTGPAGALALGPESMASFPGPACYALGGDQATLTDAFVAGGLINPDYFLGGAKQIDLALARRVVEEQVARPLQVSVEEACRRAIQRAFQSVADMIAAAREELGKDFSSHTLFAYGGNGGLFACGAAERAGLGQVYFFSLGSVFSAFGSSVSDISHVYERPLYLSSLEHGEVARIRQAVEEMKNEGRKDLLGEGIQPSGIVETTELEVVNGNGAPAISVPCPESALSSARDLSAHLAASLRGRQDGLSVEVARLRVTKPVPRHSFSKRPLQGADSASARKGVRQVAWGSKDGDARLYRWESLEPGNRLEGCAVLEGEYSTYFVPQGWDLEMDPWGNALVRRK